MKKNPLLKFIKLANDDSSKKTLDENRRGDSLDADRISKLYNLDVNKNGKRNITQEAHPEMLVAFPSYDKINGVIKNDNEKQDLTINILNGQFTTSLINEKLASESRLISSIVKAADYLETQNAPLAMYCDQILVQFDKIQTKNAGAPLVAAIIIPAAIVGLMYWQQHSSSANLGLLENIKRMGSEIDDILNDKAFITGRDYNQEFKARLLTCKNNLSKILVIYRELKSKITSFSFPENAEELLALSKDISSQEIIEKFNEFKNISIKMFNYLNNLKETLSDDDMKAMQVSQKGFLTDLIDRTKILSGGSGLIKDDIDDLLALIDPVRASLLKTIDVMKKSQEKAQEVISMATKAPAVKEKSDFSSDEEGKTKKSLEEFANKIKM